MKIRIGFVSNSSSSSFVCEIAKNKLVIPIGEVKEKLKKMFDCYIEVTDPEDLYGDVKKFEDAFIEPFVADKKYENFLIDGWDYGDEIQTYNHGKVEGKLIVASIGDNTIPYQLFEFIEEIFHAHRYHLG